MHCWGFGSLSAEIEGAEVSEEIREASVQFCLPCYGLARRRERVVIAAAAAREPGSGEVTRSKAVRTRAAQTPRRRHGLG